MIPALVTSVGGRANHLPRSESSGDAVETLCGQIATWGHVSPSRYTGTCKRCAIVAGLPYTTGSDLLDQLIAQVSDSRLSGSARYSRAESLHRAMRRVLRHVQVDDGCWLWTGNIDHAGYGVLNVGGATVRAHRLVYELFTASIPDGLHVDHLCRVRNCVRPDHLEAVTQAENNRRAAAVLTHCPQGHPYDEENTYLWAGKHRQCKTCSRSHTRAMRQRKREAVA